MSEFDKLAQSEAMEYRRKGDECKRLAALCFRDNDFAGYREWHNKAAIWYAKANRLAYVFPDLDPETPKES